MYCKLKLPPNSPLMLAIDIYHKARSTGASVSEGIALMTLVWEWCGRDIKLWFGADPRYEV